MAIQLCTTNISTTDSTFLPECGVLADYERADGGLRFGASLSFIMNTVFAELRTCHFLSLPLSFSFPPSLSHSFML